MRLKDIQNLASDMILNNRDFYTIGELTIQAFLHSEFICPTGVITLHNTPIMKIQDIGNGNVRLFFPKTDIPTELGKGFVFSSNEPLDRLLSKEVLEEAPVARLVYNCLTNAFEGKENN